jgi:hypothetical protein
MEVKEQHIRLLKLNFEHLISLIELSEKITATKDFVLKKRIIDIISTSLSECLKNSKSENCKWLIESVNTFSRYYPDNVVDSGFDILNKQMEKIYYNINAINEIFYRINHESPI